MMWMRGAPADWDALAARSNGRWSWSDVLPAYKAMEDHALGPDETRGVGGPLGISVTESHDDVTLKLLASAVSYGWQHVADANAHDTERIAFTPSTIRNGRRTTSYSAYVRPLLARGASNLRLATRTRADKLLFDTHDATRVTGVRILDSSNKPRDIKARREVILCAGAIETPLLLERSGIGRPDVLHACGIPVRIESPNVGERLIEQRGVALQVRLRPRETATFRPGGPSTSKGLSGWPGQIGAALRYLATGTGPLATAGYDLVCQFKSARERDRPDIQGLFVPMALDTSSDHMKLARHPGILFMAYPIRPQTASSVHATSQDPAAPPAIDPRFLESQADRDAAAAILRIAREVLATSPVAELIETEEFPGPAVTTSDEVVEYSLRHGSGIYHAVGSAAMGKNDDDVTDPQLRVRGTEGLRIADASVLPVQLSGNTAAPAMLVGYRAADLIRSDV
jgi:choline dehydrogenase-like flavoprotein